MSLSVKPALNLATETAQKAAKAVKKAPQPRIRVKNPEVDHLAKQTEAKLSELQGQQSAQLKAVIAKITSPFTASAKAVSNVASGAVSFVSKGTKQLTSDITEAHKATSEAVSELAQGASNARKAVTSYISEARESISKKLETRANIKEHNSMVKANAKAKYEAEHGPVLSTRVANGTKSLLSAIQAPFKALQELGDKLEAKHQKAAAETAKFKPWNDGVKARANASEAAKKAEAKAAEKTAKAQAKAAAKEADAPRQAMIKTQREQKWNQIKFDTHRALVATGNGIASATKATGKGIATAASATFKAISSAASFIATHVSGAASSAKTASAKKASHLFEASGLKAVAETRKAIKATKAEGKYLEQMDKAISTNKRFNALKETKTSLSNDLKAAKASYNRKAGTAKTADAKIAKEKSFKTSLNNDKAHVGIIEAQVAALKGRAGLKQKTALLNQKAEFEANIAKTTAQLKQIATLKAGKAKRAADLKALDAKASAIASQLEANEKALLKFPVYKKEQDAIAAKAAAKKPAAKKAAAPKAKTAPTPAAKAAAQAPKAKKTTKK